MWAAVWVFTEVITKAKTYLNNITDSFQPLLGSTKISQCLRSPLEWDGLGDLLWCSCVECLTLKEADAQMGHGYYQLAPALVSSLLCAAADWLCHQAPPPTSPPTRLDDELQASLAAWNGVHFLSPQVGVVMIACPRQSHRKSSITLHVMDQRIALQHTVQYSF